MTTPETPKGRVRLYACGGGGINVGHRFERHRGADEVGFALIDTVYIDTSKSNLRRDIPADAVYLLEGLDGSGKLRKENYQVISDRVRDMLKEFPPQDVAVVLSTAAGGSGSVIAPSIVSELLDQEIPTIVLTIGSAETRLDAENTLKTLKSYEGVAKLRRAPVVIAYFQNGAGVSRTQVDDRAESVITALAALYSRHNRELDSQDLFNWLRFERVTTFQTPLAALTLVDKNTPSELIEGLGNVISVATLAVHVEDTKFPQMPEVQYVGFMPEGCSEEITKAVPMHYVTSDGVIPAAAQRLQDLLKELENAQRQRSRASNVLSSSDGTTDTGIVL